MTERTLVHAYLEQAAARPQHPAVRTPETTWSYAELTERAAGVAAGLERAGLVPGQRCALLFAHSAEMVSGVLGALMAGLVYVPLDAAYPPARLRQMLELSGARIVLTDAANRNLADTLVGPASVTISAGTRSAVETSAAWTHRRPDDEVYVLFTSGSTGVPKPVVQTHRNVAHHAAAWADGLGIRPDDRVSLQSAYSWDSSVQDMYGALLTGATLCPVNLRALGIGGLIDWFQHCGMSVYHSTLPVFRALSRGLTERGETLTSMRILALGGDPILAPDLDYYRRLYPPACRLASAYGSTECSCALLTVLDRSIELVTPALPLGSPVARTAVTLVDTAGAVVEGAGEGELVVHSPYLSLGHGRELAGRPGTLRTGDLAVRAPDGTLTLVGRADFVVKISGIRVDLGEAEGVIGQSGIVSSVAVAAIPDELGEAQLVAYVVPRSGAMDLPALRAYLADRLPEQARPARFVVVEELPLTANLKIDRRALSALPASRTDRTAVPRGRGLPGALQSALAEVLGGRVVGVEEKFFDAGMNSLRLASFHERVTRLGHPVRLVDIYRAGSIAELARHLDGSAPTSVVAEASARGARRRTLAGTRRSKTGSHVNRQETES
jgi:amino acid adenylation domain-containing protein